jgi:hypothetical protein
MENKEFEEKMVDLYLNGYGSDGPPGGGDGAGARPNGAGAS